MLKKREIKKCIEEGLLAPAIGRITGESDIPLIKCSYKGYNFVYYFDMLSLDEKSKALISYYIEVFSEVTSPYDEKLPKESGISSVYTYYIFCEMVRRVCLKSHEDQKKFIMERLDDKLEQFMQKLSKEKASSSVEKKLVSLIN